MTIEVDIVTLPAAYASAFVNGDFSGLDVEDARRAHALAAELETDGWRIVDVARGADGEPADASFTWRFRLYGGDAEGGSVLDYVAHRCGHV